MEARKVITNKNMPTRLPVFQTITIALALDHWNASDVARDVIWTLVGLLWVVCIYSFWTQEEVDVINGDANP